jgi:peptidoglycan/xylan/chitin deacetylase (PgdA/CDA1 family)
MRYVILRDDDTNALTPVECLERLYRPFLNRGLPVNLAVIPSVRTDTLNLQGQREGYLFQRNGDISRTLNIADNPRLVSYLRSNAGYHIVQHGYQHLLFEFDSTDLSNVSQRLDGGAELLKLAGFANPRTFVAPYDRLSRVSVIEVARRFQVLSTGWFERQRLPMTWQPKYFVKKLLRRTHWQKGRTLMLTHPGCLLSNQRPVNTMLDEVKKAVASRCLTVLVTHWWEYFPGGKPNEPFIRVLHQVADHLAGIPDIQVLTFDDLIDRNIRLN